MTFPLILIVLFSSLLVADNLAAEPIDIGSRRELFVDRYLIDSMNGDIRLQLHRPTRREIVFETDAPWEGNASIFQSVFKDEDIYRMYYRGFKYRPDGRGDGHGLCYAESDDGIHWRRPKLNLYPYKSEPTNIILKPSSAHEAVFKDSNPDCRPEEKYKLATVDHQRNGLCWYGSPDGIHFSPIQNKKLFLTKGRFDSQNVAFWDPAAKLYREYHRDTKKVTPDSHREEMMQGEPAPRIMQMARWIRTSTSKDLFSFPEPSDDHQGEELEYPGAPIDGLYMSNIQPYYRAPHMLMGFPARYVNRGWSEPVYGLPGLEDRLRRVKNSSVGEFGRNGSAITDTLFMTSRDGRTFNRWAEAFLRPGPREKSSWVYGDNFLFWGMVETESAIEDAPNEISMYATEGYWQGKSTSFRRLTMRMDGFVSASASLAGGEIVTKPIRFEGGNLTLNLETSAAGRVQVEIQDVDGTPIDGYALSDCPPIYCDRIAQVVRWNGLGGDVRPLGGKIVRLRFVLKDADLYSFQFVPYAPDPERPNIPTPTKDLGAAALKAAKE